jgi:hypothetical protein
VRRLLIECRRRRGIGSRNLLVISPMINGRAAVLVVDVERDGDDEDKALDGLDLLVPDSLQLQPAVQHRHHQTASDRTDDRADAARDRGAADEYGGDGIELPADAIARARSADLATDIIPARAESMLSSS